MNVDVIYAFPGTASALAAKRATSSIPIVFHSSADPVGFGLVASLAKPGGNITGLAQQTFDQTSKSLQFLSEASKKLSSFAFIASLRAQSAPWFQGTIAASHKAAAGLGIRVQTSDVDSFQSLEPVVQDLVRRGVNGVALLSYGDDLTPAREADIASLFVRYKLPSVGTPRLGFLLEMGTPYGYEARTSASLVDKILSGAKPVDLPIEQPDVWELEINLKTAKALGLDLPQTLLLRAARLIS